MTKTGLAKIEPAADRDIAAGERFGFGENWSRFLAVLNEDRILEAEKSLTRLFGEPGLGSKAGLDGKTFLDVGSGSGLFSLAARRLGATVHSFDFDPQSVACARELKRRYFPDDGCWNIEPGSALDREFVASLGTFDIVYSWGVLHHTGDMWKGLDVVTEATRPGGRLCIMIYLDRGFYSVFWRRIKRLYCSGTLGRWIVLGAFIPYFVVSGFCVDLLRGKSPARRYTEYKRRRGMSKVHDWLDWLGGYPYEVATPKQLRDFYAERGFQAVTERGQELGYVEILFERDRAQPE